MNSLSLVIYLADILPSFKGGFMAMCVIVLLCSIVAIVLLFGLNRSIGPGCRVWVPGDHGGRYEDKQYMECHKPLPTYLAVIISVISGFICMLLLFIPSKETILLMAGSEFSEQVVNTPEAKELLEGVRQVIKSQLEQYTKKE